ncbi:MAG: hypothetical protein ACLVAW_23830 [Eisenbergiella massiliensis]
MFIQKETYKRGGCQKKDNKQIEPCQNAHIYRKSKEIREHGNACIIYFGHLRKIPMAVFMALALQLAEFIIFLIAVVGGQAFIRRLSQIIGIHFVFMPIDTFLPEALQTGDCRNTDGKIKCYHRSLKDTFSFCHRINYRLGQKSGKHRQSHPGQHEKQTPE